MRVTGDSLYGDSMERMLKPGRFRPIKRSWKSGDDVEVEFDMPVRLETLDMNLTTPLTTESRTLLVNAAKTQPGALMSGPVVAAEIMKAICRRDRLPDGER